MRAFLDKFAEWGVRPGAVQSSYAMAENVFAVTQSHLDGEPATVPRSRIRDGHDRSPDLAFSLLDDVFVSSGHSLPGYEVRITDATGALKPMV